MGAVASGGTSQAVTNGAASDADLAGNAQISIGSKKLAVK